MILEMSRRLRDRDEVQFFLRWLRRPARLGAVVPSGPNLAAALAAEIDTEAPGAVVELGSGTGRVTAALLKAGVVPGTLIAIEREASFCALLAARFPGARVVRGDARALERLLERNQVGAVKAVVSSLPLLNLSERERRAVLTQAAAALEPGGVLVQYPYGPAEPVSAKLRAELGLIGERTHWVLATLPPAAVWRYRRADSPPGLPRAA
jgi:phosphatidylethanolamine/phosphatidyl-N-methylethanolamine N-methyltransferase